MNSRNQALAVIELLSLSSTLLLAGLLLAAALHSPRASLRLPCRAFVELTRNTPTLVQLYCAFLVLNLLITQQLQGRLHNPLGPFVWVVLVVSECVDPVKLSWRSINGKSDARLENSKKS